MAGMRFGEAVRLLRERQGLTQAELATRAKLARQSLIRIEQAAGSPPHGTYHRLVNALGFTLGHDLLVAAGADLEPLAVSRPVRAATSPGDLAVAVARTPWPIVPALSVAGRPGARRQRLASATRRGYGVEHKRLRVFILRRDPWCQGVPEGVHRLQPVRTTVMDHIVSLRNGGSTTPANCRGLCRACNARKAIWQEGAGYTRRPTPAPPRWRLLA